MRQRQHGLTAIELLLVVVVLGIFSVIATPRIGDALMTERLRANTRLLATDAQYMRQLAMTRGTTIRMQFVRNSSGPHEVRYFDQAHPTTELRSYRRFLPADIVFDTASIHFVFNHFGEPVPFGNNPANASIGLQARNGRELYLVLSLAGRIRVSPTRP